MKKEDNLQLLLIPAALLLCVWLVLRIPPAGIMISVVMPLMLPALLPRCRANANLWVFAFVFAFDFLPNCALLRKVIPMLKDMIFIDNPVMVIIGSVIAVFMLFSLEEIIYGVIARILWRDQKLLDL